MVGATDNRLVSDFGGGIPMRMRLFGPAVLLLQSCFASSSLSQDVLFSQAFGASSLGNDIVIEVPTGSALIFDKDGPFVLEGRNLIVFAEKAVLTANPQILSFGAGNVPTTIEGVPADVPDRGGSSSEQGMDGNDGAIGKPGRGSGVCALDIGDLSTRGGAYTITINAAGQQGGKGQKGGKGGRGGGGASGSNAGGFPCGDPCPNSGDRGGTGGFPGRGGKGGPGGTGGKVLLSASLYALFGAGSPMLNIKVDGGLGGVPGDVGERGIGGPGGPRGSGSSSCVCKDPPPPGPDGFPGPAEPRTSTEPSAPGSVGSVERLK